MPGSLSPFAKDVLEGITKAEKPLQDAATKPFIKAQDDLERARKAMEASLNVVTFGLSGAIMGALEPNTTTTPTSETKNPVVVQIHVDGKLIKTETIGTIGAAAGFAGITGYSGLK